jgi:hypothetical protein
MLQLSCRCYTTFLLGRLKLGCAAVTPPKRFLRGKAAQRKRKCLLRVKTGKAQREQMFSALPPEADMAGGGWVRKVPSGDLEACVS